MQGDIGKRRVAIACEGGGSHTAFTSGVLQRLLRESVEIVALSGTSGGAVCAVLTWRGLLSGNRDDAVKRLRSFWRDIAIDGAQALLEKVFLDAARLVGEVVSPETSPYWHLGDARKQLREVLERHCGFAQMPELLRRNPAAPRLLISASNVRSGEFAIFRSHPVTHRNREYRADAITADVILASAAVPSLFRAVHIDEHDYWDGLFSQNPPIRELPDMARTLPDNKPPQEIWIVRINPQKSPVVPKSMAEIRDRRNELAGIISLNQELYFIGFLNHLIQSGKLAGTKHEPIKIRSIRMSDEFASVLDYESKLNRSWHHIRKLEDHGLKRAEEFLQDPDRHLEPI